MSSRRAPAIRGWFIGLILRVFGTTAVVAADAAYQSPYSIHWTVDFAQLTADFNQPPRADPGSISVPPAAQWYNPASYTKAAMPWGPRPGHYPAPTVPPGVDRTSWMQQRILAVALKYAGTPYQHHHLPTWDPSSHDWPAWLDVSLGHNSAGIDCSNFTGWCYNYGLGYKLDTATGEQAEKTQVEGPNGPLTVQTLMQVNGSEPVDYEQLVATLKPGDLLYIRGRADGQKITHVIIWVGSVGVNPDKEPLIIDSHDNKPPVLDSNHVVIPAGVALRPFRKGSWYHRAFDHAHRLILQ